MTRPYLIYSGSVSVCVAAFTWIAVTGGFYWWEPLVWALMVTVWVVHFVKLRHWAAERRQWAEVAKAYDEVWQMDAARWPRPWIHHDLDGYHWGGDEAL